MKKILGVAIILCTVRYNGQTNDFTKNGLYIFNQAILMQPSDIVGIPLSSSVTGKPEIETSSEPGQKFRVLEIVSGSLAVIQVLGYTKVAQDTNLKKKSVKLEPTDPFYKFNFKGDLDDYKSLGPAKLNARDYGNKQRYFTILASVLSSDDLCKREDHVQGALAVGALNFPFKYRRQPGDFSGAFNFGVAVGWKIPHKSWRKFTISLVGGFSISNVTLDSSNTRKNQSKLASLNNFTAGSLSGGCLLENGKVQVGAFIGFDRLTRINQQQFDWEYQAKSWFSLGIGIGIFSPQENTRASAADHN